MRVRAALRPIAVLALLALLAGCSSPPAPLPTDAPQETQRSTGAAGTDGIPSQRILDVEGEMALDAVLPATTMEVPPNVTLLNARFVITPSGPCGLAASEPLQQPASWVVFTGPSGTTARIEAPTEALVCNVASLSATVPQATADFVAEQGRWSVEFAGRGVAAHVHLVVDGALA